MVLHSTSTMSDPPAWEPNVAVIGLGAAGTATVEQIDTDTAATFRTAADPTEVSEPVREATRTTGFVFLTGDAGERDVVERAHDLAQETNACSVFVAEGLAEVPADLVAATNLVVPINLDAVPSIIMSSVIVDLFEAMMTPTVRALGHGDIRTVVGDGRVGQFAIRPLGDDESMWLSPPINGGERAATLVFVCSGRERPVAEVERAVERADEDGLSALLWDQRLHDRYAGTPHVKRLVTLDYEVP